MDRISQLYQQLTGKTPQRIVPLAGAGSNRQYFRVFGGDELSTLASCPLLLTSLIAVIGTNQEENEAFIDLAKRFKDADLPVPALLAVSDDRMVYLQEDCGDVSLYAFMNQHRQADGTFDDEALTALKATIRELPRFQLLPLSQHSTLNTQHSTFFSHCFPQQAMDRTSIMFDLNYFKYCFLKLKGIEFNEFKLQQDFERLADDLLEDQEDTFLYRDFQSRNVMLKDGKPYFIDFQGGRKGPIYYDVASFLWQSSANFSDEVRNLLIDEYLDALRSQLSTFDFRLSTFKSRLNLFVLFRILQVLGAYGYRGLWEKKKYFINSIPHAIKNLQQELSLGICNAYPYLKEICQTLISLNVEEEKNRVEEAAKRDKVTSYLQQDNTYLNKESKVPLVVRVFSFSFKKGLPEDKSGNGGGYVFDCRSTHNPGRYDEYKPLTGLDKPVIDFLEADGEILTFLDSVYRLVDFHVARFKERGFTNMQISFGCTGGRHRSVYCAQHVAEHIHEKFGVEVHLCHREQNITSHLSPHTSHL
ncbi:MAG: phosphotransferase [Bacteroidaceae bacterium]|nr:phosphotransferase [Bacteroidaceae bacterium]